MTSNGKMALRSPALAGGMRARLPPTLRDYLIASAVLFAPLGICLFVSDGLRLHVPTFHSTDEYRYHLPIIEEFLDSFPKMALWDYRSATTPLFHIIMAVVAKMFGLSLPILRGVNMAATLLAGLGTFALFRTVLRIDLVTSICIAATLLLSPYVLGSGLVLLTDNIALAFALGSLVFCIRSLRSADALDLAGAAFLACLAILTRQLYVWLVPMMVLCAGFARGSAGGRHVVLGLLLGVLALAPYTLLCLGWGGPNPPQFQFFRALNPGAVTFMLACIGLYAGPFMLLGWWAGRYRPALRSAAFVIGATTLVLVIAPLPYLEDVPLPTEGFLWRISHRLPTLAGSSLLFWALVPFGIAALIKAWRDEQVRSAGLWIFALCTPVLVANASPFQKYYDTTALLIALLIVFRPSTVKEGTFEANRARLILAVYMLLSTAYFIRYAAGYPAS